MTDYSEINKQSIDEMLVKPNLDHSHVLGGDFDWKQIEEELGVASREEINQAYLAIDRHAASSRRDKIALLWEGKSGDIEQYTYSELATLTDQFTNVVKGLGITKGERVFTYMERVPELYIAIFGSLKLGAIVSPLFADFGPDPVRDRLRDSGAKVLITSPALRAHIATIFNDLPNLEYVIVIDRGGQYSQQDRDIIYHEAMANASSDFTNNKVGADEGARFT
jgi:acetyl-CoA synthetase